MRILHLVNSSRHGGAAKAASRLNSALLGYNVDSKLFVLDQSHDVLVSHLIRVSRLGYVFSLYIKAYQRILRRIKIGTALDVSNPFIRRQLEKELWDVLLIHWIPEGMLSMKDLKKLASKGRLYIVLHDVRFMTSRCHYPILCNPQKEENTVCSETCSFHKNQLPFSTLRDVNFIALSSWLYKYALESGLDNNRISLIKNCLDKTYLEVDIHVKREKYIVVGGMNLSGDIRKGFNFIINTLDNIPNDHSLLVLGEEQEDLKFNPLIKFTGYLDSDEKIVNYLKNSSFAIVPSIQENYSNMILECLACGLPVLCFNIGGNPDLIEHKINGYLVRINDSEDFEQGIRYLAVNSSGMREECSRRVREENNPELIAQLYLEYL